MRPPSTSSTQKNGALLVLPTHLSRSASVDSVWLAAAGLGKALQDLVGGCDVLTPYGLMGPEELTQHPVRGETINGGLREAVRKLPLAVRVPLGDALTWWRARSMRRIETLVDSHRYGLVVQYHRRFHDSGLRIAQRLALPFVLKMDALEVREEAAWGVRRPVWGPWVEKVGELRLIRRAQLVAPVSETLDAQLADVGIPASKRLVLSNGVDLQAFHPGAPDPELRTAGGLSGRFVVGWVGGFRPFHGLEQIPEIARELRDRLPEAVLCLVGTGPLMEKVAQDTRDLTETVRLVGAVHYERIPDWIRAFDACLLLASPGPFHYSPVKLYEYLGCGRPVVAARVGEVAKVLGDGGGILVDRGDARAVVDAVEQLARDRTLRMQLGAEGRQIAERSASWDARAKMLIRALQDRDLIQ